MLGEVYQANYIYGRYEFRINICRFTDSYGYFIKLFKISTGRMLNSWDGHYKAVTALKWTDNDTFLLSAGEDALLNLWSLSM